MSDVSMKPIEWDWSTVTQEFKTGKDVPPQLAMEFLSAYNELNDWRACEEELRGWSVEEGCGDCCMQDLTLYIHTNNHTKDTIRVWNYGMGDNDYGSFFFQQGGEGAGEGEDGVSASAFCFIHNRDGELMFQKAYDEVGGWPPSVFESGSADRARVVAGLVKWYAAIEEDEELARAAMGNNVKRVGPSSDPDTWKHLAGWDEDEDEESDSDEEDA